jgi:hypothetical protein
LDLHIAQLNDVLSRAMCADEHYTQQELGLLKDFLTIPTNPNKLQMLACAQEAVEELSCSIGTPIRLTQFGAEETGPHRATSSLQRAVGINRAFLEIWRKKMQQWKTVKDTTHNIQSRVADVLNRADGLRALPDALAELLSQDGFQIVNNSCQGQTTVEMLEQGILLLAKNAQHHEREVRVLPNGQMFVHAHIPGDLDACKKEEASLTKRVLTLIEEQSTRAGVPLKLHVERSGTGRLHPVTASTKKTEEGASKEKPLRT